MDLRALPSQEPGARCAGLERRSGKGLTAPSTGGGSKGETQGGQRTRSPQGDVGQQAFSCGQCRLRGHQCPLRPDVV